MLSIRVFAIALAVLLVLCSVEAQRSRGGRRGGRGGRGGPPPSRPCRVLNGEGVEIKSRECPGDLTCTVGPISKSVNGSRFSIYLCTLTPTIANRLVREACKVEDVETSVMLSSTDCQEDRPCIIGPFSATVNDAAVTFYMCDRPHRRPHGRHPEGGRPKTGKSKGQCPQGHRPCRVLDADGDIVETDNCPSGMDCTRGPKELRRGRQAGNTAYFCQPIEDVEPEVAPLRAFELEAKADFYDDMSGSGLEDDDMSGSGREDHDSHEKDFMGRRRGPRGGRTARGSRRRPF